MSSYGKTCRLSVQQCEASEIIFYLAGYLEDVEMLGETDVHVHGAISMIKALSIQGRSPGMFCTVPAHPLELDAVEYALRSNIHAIDAGVMDPRYRVSLDLLLHAVAMGRK